MPDTVAKLQQLIHEDQRQTIQDLAHEITIGYGTCQWILTAESWHVSGAQDSKVNQKQQHIEVCEELHQIASNNATFLSRVITGDKSCIYSYDLETKQQSSQWKTPNSPRPKKARQV
jgi:hypothetical protein